MIYVAGPSIGQESQAERAGVELELTPIGQEPLCFLSMQGTL